MHLDFGRCRRWLRILFVPAAVFATSPSSAHAVVSFNTLITFNRTNGENPQGALIGDGAGNVYGTTFYGGAFNQGTIFRLNTNTNSLTTLASFNPSTTGINPGNRLTMDPAGNLYGTTQFGGPSLTGTVFRLDAATNQIATLTRFAGQPVGTPGGGVILDKAGNVYGTTVDSAGGSLGRLFRIAAGTNELTTLVEFNGTNGQSPASTLIRDAAGNFYGSTVKGGANNLGSVYRYSVETNTLTTLGSFSTASGYWPHGQLAMNSTGSLFGTTQFTANDSGTVFKVAPTGGIQKIAAFNSSVGVEPTCDLLIDAAGNLFGVTNQGALGFGSIFRIDSRTNVLSVLYRFRSQDGHRPTGGLYADLNGTLYGVTYSGGELDSGTIFSLTGSGFIVPEPGCLSLLATCGFGTLLRRRRGA